MLRAVPPLQRRVQVCTQTQVQVQGMATLKEIAMRLKSIKSIQKITKSMKMVSAAKFSRAERNLKSGKAISQSGRFLAEKNDLSIEDSYRGRLIVALSSDRGLCGGIHSAIAKAVRPRLNNDTEAKVFVIGDKARSQLQRTHPKSLAFSVNEYGKKPPTFIDASLVAAHIIQQDVFKGEIVFNKFKSAIAYEPTVVPFYSQAALSENEEFAKYEIEDEALRSYQEFHLATLVYGALLDGAASEQSARMTAMENATKNAGEMINKLALLYNRTRQAVITNELIEIISGAAAV
jgi:F-type H+-transporting ATPase subunit gamma